RHFDSGSCEWAENASADWHSILGSGAYPHAPKPLRKAVVRADYSRQPSADAIWFITGLWLEDAVASASWDARTARLDVRLVASPEPVDETLEFGELTVQVVG